MSTNNYTVLSTSAIVFDSEGYIKNQGVQVCDFGDTVNMKLNKNTLAKAWGMSIKNAAIFARYETLDGVLWVFSEDRKVSDHGTREAAKALNELGYKEFCKLSNKKAKEETLRRLLIERESDAQSLCNEIDRQESGYHHSLHTV